MVCTHQNIPTMMIAPRRARPFRMHSQDTPAARKHRNAQRRGAGLVDGEEGGDEEKADRADHECGDDDGANTSRARCSGSSSPCHLAKARRSPRTTASPAARHATLRAWYGEEARRTGPEGETICGQRTYLKVTLNPASQLVPGPGSKKRPLPSLTMTEPT